MRGKPIRLARLSVGRGDVANWTGIGMRMLVKHQSLDAPISARCQRLYSQFFAIYDKGRFEVRWVGHKKTLVIVEPPPDRKPPALHRIDFGCTVPKIRME